MIWKNTFQAFFEHVSPRAFTLPKGYFYGQQKMWLFPRDAS